MSENAPSETALAATTLPARLVHRLMHRLFGQPLVVNSFRGQLVEEMVLAALEPEWQHCGGDWAGYDLQAPATGLRLEVKQSAARQTWTQDGGGPSAPRFDIAARTGRWEGATWVVDLRRHADIYVFAWHPRTDPNADHRDPQQWQFYVCRASDLPATAKSLSLKTLQRQASPVAWAELAAAVGAVAAVVPAMATARPQAQP